MFKTGSELKKISVILFWLVALLLVLVPHIWVQLGNEGIIGGDGYYHIRYAELLRLAWPNLSIPFPWLPLTILNPSEFTNHHLLFHILLMPFTFGDLIIGAKIATVLFAAAATLTWFLIARVQNVKWPIFWLLALYASSSDFLYRLSMTRRQSLVLLLLLLAVYLVLKRRLKWLIFLGFAFAWLYDGWIILLVVVGIAYVGRFIESRCFDLRLVLAPTAGLVLGIIANPFFPNNLIFGIRHLMPKVQQQAFYFLSFVWETFPYPREWIFEVRRIPILPVGSEWYPYMRTDLLDGAGFALVLLFFGLTISLWLILRKQLKLEAHIIAWGGSTLFFTMLLLLSKRFAEYQPAFATMFAAVAWSALIKTEKAQRFFVNWKKLLHPTWIALVIVMPIAGYTLINARYKASTDPPSTKYAAASHFLTENSLPGERIFTSGWDEFPWLFFYNTKNAYLVGLDPYYMYQYNPNLYWRWEAITRGEEADPAEEIRSRFSSRWVFIDRHFTEFLKRARKDSNMQQVYKDKWATIFKIKNLP